MPRDAVMVLGATGVFGSRLCQLLARERRWRVIAAGRDAARLDALRRAIRCRVPGAGIETRVFDLPGGLSTALANVAVAVHTAGPFQGQDYAVPRACIAAGVHYVDLADGRAFVAGFAALDEAARANDVLAVSGASSVPGLSGAAVAHLRPLFSTVDRVSIGISPGNQAPRGRALVAAMLAMAGQPMPGGFAWQGLRRHVLDCPNAPPLPPRWFARVDVPDLEVLPRRDPSLTRVEFHAGLDLAVMQIGLWAMTWPVRWGWVRDLTGLADPLTRVAGWLQRFGSDRGGMFVTLSGRDVSDQPARRTWSLIAERGDGPWIPTLPALLVTRKLLDGALRCRGARPCLDLFSLAEIEAEFERFDIVTGAA